MEVGMATLAPGAVTGFIGNGLIEIDIIGFVCSVGVSRSASPLDILGQIDGLSGFLIVKPFAADSAGIVIEVSPLALNLIRIAGASSAVRLMAIDTGQAFDGIGSPGTAGSGSGGMEGMAMVFAAIADFAQETSFPVGGNENFGDAINVDNVSPVMAGKAEFVDLVAEQGIVGTGRTKVRNGIFVAVTKHVLLAVVHRVALVAAERAVKMVFAGE
jgi:hypothetical protein